MLNVGKIKCNTSSLLSDSKISETLNHSILISLGAFFLNFDCHILGPALPYFIILLTHTYFLDLFCYLLIFYELSSTFPWNKIRIFLQTIICLLYQFHWEEVVSSDISSIFLNDTSWSLHIFRTVKQFLLAFRTKLNIFDLFVPNSFCEYCHCNL